MTDKRIDLGEELVIPDKKTRVTFDFGARTATFSVDRGDLMLPLRVTIPMTHLKRALIEILRVEAESEEVVLAQIASGNLALPGGASGILAPGFPKPPKGGL